ncbi:MAG: trypsin-like peptidase domain-containing protein [Miniphocaeibacter sp.]|uniref:S1C family serine protease n=1 Tax=Miniphocaeibacter sp. TaxID=3100973 RepID=UPI003BAE8C5E
MSDDKRDFDENRTDEDTERNDFSNNSKGSYYDPLGTEDEGPAFSRSYSYNNSDEVRKIVKEELKRNKPKTPWIRIVVIALIFSFLSSGVTALVMSSKNNTTAGNSGTNSSITINTKDEVNIETAVAEKVIPSVVGITTKTLSNSIFNQQAYVEGVGSGVIVSEDGYILTNSHVISDGSAESITVVFSDKSTIEGKLIWNNSTLDLAVVKVEKTGLPVVEFGDSDKVSVGDKAIAIGNPLGLDLQSTLTSGYISGLNRMITLENGASMDGLIQTDAAINGGNSGGALLNSKGELIGINTAKASTGEGIGFAIPINTAKSIVDEIIETGNYEELLLGISGVELETYKKYFQMETPVEKGVAVMQVQENSPADKAGIQVNDIITQVGDSEVGNTNDIKKALLKYKFGDSSEITIYRNGKEEKLEITFEKFEVQENPINEQEQNKEEQGGNEREFIFPWGN